MKTLIMCCGLPFSGADETCGTISKFLYDLSTKYPSIGKIDSIVEGHFDSSYNKGALNASKTNVILEAVKWINNDSADYMLVYLPLMTAFDRMDFIGNILDVSGADSDNIRIIAIYHDRSNRYITEHNVNGKGEEILDRRRMGWYLHSNQQPVREEGFDFIFRVTGSSPINMEKFYTLMHRNFSDDPVWALNLTFNQDGTEFNINDSNVEETHEEN